MIWTVTITGAKQPINTTPSRDGNLVLLKRDGTDAQSPPLSLEISNLTERARDAAKEHGVAFYLPHHATCPERGKFKGPRSKETSDGTEQEA